MEALLSLEGTNRLPLASPLLRPWYRDFLAANDDVADFQRVTPEHQTGAHAKSTDRAVAVHIDFRRFDAAFL